jgi:large subunit ribosomal protein L4
VVASQAAARSGSASTLSKGEVAGSNRKPWRQKGTGRARAGYRQSPVWRGGAVAFGPKPRSHAVKVNKKVARLAFRRAVGEKVAAGALRVLDSLALPEARTRLFAELMQALDVRAPALFVVDALDENAALASRNIPGVEITLAKDLNVYQLLRYPAVIVTRAGMDVVLGRMAGNGGGKP